MVPLRAIAIIAGIGVMVVMVALPEAYQGDEPAIPAAVMIAVRLRPKHVAQGIDGKGRIQNHEHAEHAGQKKAADSANQAAVQVSENERESQA